MYLGDHLAAKGKKEKHFCSPWKKNRNILAAHFEAWKSFASILKLGDHFVAISNQKEKRNIKKKITSHFLSLEIVSVAGGGFWRGGILAAAKWAYDAAKWHSCAKGWFRSCETPFEMAPRLRNSSSALRICLQTAITFSFQLQIAHRLKL